MDFIRNNWTKISIVLLAIVIVLFVQTRSVTQYSQTQWEEYYVCVTLAIPESSRYDDYTVLKTFIEKCNKQRWGL